MPNKDHTSGPRKGSAGIIENLLEGQTRIEQKLNELLVRSQQSQFITIAGISREVGRTKEWISRNPWVLPGPPDIEGRPKKWLRSRWEEYKKNLPEHKRRWPKIIKIA